MSVLMGRGIRQEVRVISSEGIVEGQGFIAGNLVV